MTHKFAIAALALAFSAPVLAEQCSMDIEANDTMKYNKDSVTISKKCKEFTVNLKHVGKMPKASMGHNWVLTTKADMQGVVSESIKAGVANDYINPSNTKVIAHTKMIGGGETTSVAVSTSKLTAGTDYMFFCSFPGHAALMKGTVKVTD
ncbi:MAG: azurin [Betaproteobacteria bacterium]|nr:azurin [Betaproteobacteria bacterium]